MNLEEHSMEIDQIDAYYNSTEFNIVKFMNLFNYLVEEKLVFFFDSSYIS